MEKAKNLLLSGMFCAIALLAGCGAEEDAAKPWQMGSGMEDVESGSAGNGDLEAGGLKDGSLADGDSEIGGWGDGNMQGEDSQSGLQEDAEKPRELTPEELRQFTDFVNRGENNGFLLSQYAQAGEVDLGEVLYNGAGMDEVALSEEERKAYEGMGYSIETDVTRLSAGQIEDFLRRKMGIGMEDVAGGLGWVYLEESDSYVFQHGDTNYCRFVCTGGWQTGKIYEIRCKSSEAPYVPDCVVTLKRAGADYRFVSNLFAENTDDARLARRIDEQCFSVELNGWGGVEFVSLAPDILEGPMQDVSFELWQEGRAVYAFPEAAEENVRDSGEFVQIEAVAFKDYDKDGCTDVIIICTYERLPWEEADGQYQEARVYKGNEKAFRYMDEISSSLNQAQCNQSVSQILAQIEGEEPDFGGLGEGEM